MGRILMEHMTKRRYSEEAPEAPPKRGGPGLVTFMFALMFGAALALTADSKADHRSTYARVTAQVTAQVTKSISSTLRNLVVGQREYTIRLGDWPKQPAVVPASASSAEPAPAIAIVIDDLGSNATRTMQAIALPANVTLSFLPYPARTPELSHRAHLAGHEVIIHVPMQPSGTEYAGERALTTGLPVEELKQRLDWAMSRVSDYDGINNHMGSRFTTSRADLVPVMRELKGRRLFFLDSRTTAQTQVESLAREMGVLTGRRDVFIDGDRSAAAIRRQLSRLEDFARKNGNVIAIGHPYPETLNVLSEWTNDLKERGFELAPLRDVLAMREKRNPPLLTAGFALTPPR